VQAEPWFIEQQDRVLMFVRRLCEKHHEERDQPLKTFRALIELDFHAEIVLHHDF